MSIQLARGMICSTAPPVGRFDDMRGGTVQDAHLHGGKSTPSSEFGSEEQQMTSASCPRSVSLSSTARIRDDFPCPARF